MTTVKDFYAALTEEERAFGVALADDNLGIMLRCAINELDWYYYNLRRSKAPTNEQQEQFYILQLGVSRLISLALAARASFDVPVVMFPRSRHITMEVLKAVSALGIIQHGRRVAQSLELGLGSIEEATPSTFNVTLRADIPDDEYFERAIIQHYNSLSRTQFSALLATRAFKGIKQKVSDKLHELVFPYERHFIGYDADPLLDEYFFGLAYHEVQLQEGFDAFHYATRFGGIRFQAYILALTFLIATAIRHEGFAEALVAKDASVRLENILTISADTAPFAESLRDAVNHFGRVYDDFEEISTEQAHVLIDTLSVRRGNTGILDAPGSPMPPLIQSSETGLVKSLFGAQSEPIRFLLESLRFHYQREYDVNQQTREASLQSALERTLSAAFPGLTYQRNVVLRDGGRVLTDVDLAIMDAASGLVILCQMKHLELYGPNLYSKRIRAERLRSQVQDWLSALDAWNVVAGEAGLRRRLSLPSSFPELCVYRLVVTRHFAYPLKSVACGNRTVYGTWPQVVNAISSATQAGSGATLESVMSILKGYQNHQEPTHLEEPPTKWTISKVSFVVQQAGSSPLSSGGA